MNYPQNNLYTEFYKETVELLVSDDSRLVTVELYLNELDIIDLNLSDKIYVDGVQYVINRIRDYNATNPSVTKVELIKVPDLVGEPEYELLQPEILTMEFI